MHYIKDHPVTIDFSVIRAICGKLQIKLNEFEGIVNNPDNTLKLAVEAFNRGAKLEGKEPLNEPQVEEILNKAYSEFIVVFTECVLEMFTPAKKN